MRVALYGRVSKDDGKQDTDNQLHELREFCQTSGWTVEHEYVDRASGKTADRPQFKRMFDDAAKRKFDLVLFWALDRFSRAGVLETLNQLQRLSSYGVNWRSYQESYFDSCGPFKDVVVSLMATLAKQERLRISERTKAGLQRARRAGTVLGRPRVDVDRLKLRQMATEWTLIETDFSKNKAQSIDGRAFLGCCEGRTAIVAFRCMHFSDSIPKAA